MRTDLTFHELLVYTCGILIFLTIIGLGCECILQEYRTGACSYYEKTDGTLVFIKQEWISENCGCDDLLERFNRIAQSQPDSTCVVCEHPYNSCPTVSTCD